MEAGATLLLHMFFTGSVEELKSVEVEKVGRDRYLRGRGMSALSRTEDGACGPSNL